MPAATAAVLDAPQADPANTVDPARQKLADELDAAIKRGEEIEAKIEAELVPLRKKLASAKTAYDAAAKAVAEAQAKAEVATLLHQRQAEHAANMLRRTAPAEIAEARRRLEAKYDKLRELSGWTHEGYVAAQREANAIVAARAALDRLAMAALAPDALDEKLDAILDGVERAGRV